MAVLHIKGDTSMSNNPPSAQDILDAIKNKTSNQQNTFNSGATLSKLFKRVQQNGPITVALPNGKSATFSEREIDPTTDDRSLEHPISVRNALGIAFEKYEETDDDGPEIHEAIVSGKPIAVSDKNKELADKCLTYFGLFFFNKKLVDSDSLSEWENAVSKLVAVPDRDLKRKQTALAVTLPRFYSINITKKRLIELKESAPKDMRIKFDTVTKTGDKEVPLISKLQFIEQFTERNASKNHQTYIFSSNHNNSYIIKYSIDRTDFDKVRMMDYIIAERLKDDGIFSCKISAQSKSFAGEFNAMVIDQIQFM